MEKSLYFFFDFSLILYETAKIFLSRYSSFPTHCVKHDTWTK